MKSIPAWLIIILSLVAGFVGAFVFIRVDKPSQEELIAEFYEVENAVHVSPHGIRKHMGDGSTLLVDLRSQEEYEAEHIIEAVSIPAYKTPDESAYSEVDRIVNSFRALIAENPDKEIVIYCYSTPCMTGRKVGKMLTDNGIYVKHLGIGWQDWRYYWNMWNHDGEVEVNPADYVSSGPEPGIFSGLGGSGCPIGGAFGC